MTLKKNYQDLSVKSNQYQNEISSLNSIILKTFLFRMYAFSVKKLVSKNNMSNAKAIGVVLLILFFSFGFFFNNGGVHENELNRKLSFMMNKDFSLPDINNFNVTSNSDSFLTSLGKDDTKKEEETAERVEKKKIKSNKEKKTSQRKKHKNIKTETPKVNNDVNMEEYQPKQEIENIVLPEIKEWRSNTTHILCGNVKQLLPPMDIPYDPNSPMQLCMYIPPDPDEVMDPNSEKSILEVTCRVTDMRINRVYQ